MDEPTPTPTPTPTPDPTVLPTPGAAVHFASLTEDQFLIVCVFMAIVVFALGVLVVLSWKR
jgi:hypothetical protein